LNKLLHSNLMSNPRSLLDKEGGSYGEAITFYSSFNGQLQLDVLEKMTLDAVRKDEFATLTDVQKAFLGFDLMLQWQKAVLSSAE